MTATDTRILEYRYKIAAFYSFHPLEEKDLTVLKNDLTLKAKENGILGSILLANEGVNGTVCGPQEGVNSVIGTLKKLLSNELLDVKVSWADKQAFRRLRVKRKEEIVTMGVDTVDPSKRVGKYIEPNDWNTFLTDPDTLVIDTRNEYEIAIGGFQGAVNPHTKSFREFPDWVDNYLTDLVEKTSPKRIAMFCTGGIRCEKATSYLEQEGFKGVHHLHGGILRYLEEVPSSQSRWTGECFVFDQRVSLNHDLVPGDYCLCHACGMPLCSEDREAENYVRGVQCHHCENVFSDHDRARFAERQKHFDQRPQDFAGFYSGCSE